VAKASHSQNAAWFVRVVDLHGSEIATKLEEQ